MQLCAVAAAGIQLEHVALRAEEACCGRGRAAAAWVLIVAYAW